MCTLLLTSRFHEQTSDTPPELQEAATAVEDVEMEPDGQEETAAPTFPPAGPAHTRGPACRVGRRSDGRDAAGHQAVGL